MSVKKKCISFQPYPVLKLDWFLWVWLDSFGLSEIRQSLLLPTVLTPDLPTRPTQVGGPKPGRACVFPFTNPSSGLRHDACTLEAEPDDGTGRDWCSVRVDPAGEHVPGEWGYCHQLHCPTEPDFRYAYYSVLSLTSHNRKVNISPSPLFLKFLQRPALRRPGFRRLPPLAGAGLPPQELRVGRLHKR